MKEIFKKKYTVEDDVIKFKIDDQTVKKVTNFYNEAPFPNYEKNDDKSSINYKGDKNFLTREFKEFTGFDKNILEVGCGTGQLSLYLAIGNNNRVYALDPTTASINLGKNPLYFILSISSGLGKSIYNLIKFFLSNTVFVFLNHSIIDFFVNSFISYALILLWESVEFIFELIKGSIFKSFL